MRALVRSSHPRLPDTALVFAGLCLVSAPTFAGEPTTQDGERVAAAERLFQDGLSELEAGNWDNACPKFIASMDLDRSVGTMLNVAKCHEHEGKLTAALADYREALGLNEKVTDEQRRERVRAYTQERLEQLATRVPRVRIAISPHVDGLSVTRDGQDVPATSLTSPVRMDPGEHAIVVTAPGHAEERRSITLKEGQELDLSIVLQPTGDAPTGAPPPPAEPKAPPDAPPAAEDSASSNALVPIGWGIAGLGVVGIGVGAVTGILAMGQKSTVEELCPDPAKCTDEGVSEADTGSTFATVSTVGFIAGAVLTATGLVLVLGTGGDEETATLAPSVGPGHAGLMLKGSL